MPRRLPNLRRSFLLVIAAVFVPLTLVAAGLVWYQWQQQRDKGMALLEEQARVVRYALDRELTLDLAVLNALAASRDLESGNIKSFHEVAKRTAKVRPGSWVVLIDSAGRYTLNTAVPFGAPLPDLRKALAASRSATWQGREIPLLSFELLERSLRTGKPVFSGLVFGPVTGQPVVGTSVPAFRGDRATHVLGMAYSYDFFVDLLRQQIRGAHRLASILDGTGRVIAHNRSPERFVALRAPAPFGQGAGPLQEEGVGESLALDGQRTYFAYSRSRVNDWVAVVRVPVSALLEPARRTLWASAGVVLLMMTLASTVAFRLSRKIARPLAMLATRVDGSRQQVQDVPPSGVREVEALKLAMVRAAAAREERSRIEGDRERALQDLRAAHQQLVESDRRKDEFLAMLGHELRNPLAAIANAAKVLARNHLAEGQSSRMREIVDRQTRHLTRIVDDLLNVARVTHGKLAIHKASVRLDVLAERAAADALANAQRKDQRLVLRAVAPVPVEGDEVRLSQVLGNLLENAIKYTPQGGLIELAVRAEGGQALLEVADNGIGIPADLLPHIFEPFTQNAQPLDRSEGGLGLGLAVVKHIVELHGGTIEATSGGRGQGTQMQVRLPLAVAG